MNCVPEGPNPCHVFPVLGGRCQCGAQERDVTYADVITDMAIGDLLEALDQHGAKIKEQLTNAPPLKPGFDWYEG